MNQIQQEGFASRFNGSFWQDIGAQESGGDQVTASPAAMTAFNRRGGGSDGCLGK